MKCILRPHNCKPIIIFRLTIEFQNVTVAVEVVYVSLKNKLLELLENSRGEYLSGESIAEKLNVTRAAVWKSMKQLKLDGFAIEAVTNKGYALLESNDILSSIGINKYLNKDMPIVLKVYGCVTSTNALLREHLSEQEGFVIAANSQTEGVGRMGRTFFSPKDTGIYFSILLKPGVIASEAVLVTSMAAVAVCKAIEKIAQKKPVIKWVNDIYLDGKKICGILTQGSFSMENGFAEYLILGIGLNVYFPDSGFPSEIETIAGALQKNSQGDFKNKLLAEILNQFWFLYKNENKEDIVKAYKSYSFVIGKDILVISPKEEIPAKVLDIDDNCNLVVTYKNGEKAVLSSGEISIKNIGEPHENT